MNRDDDEVRKKVVDILGSAKAQGAAARYHWRERPLDRMLMIHTCHEAVADLMSPEAELQARQRDNLAMLLDFLNGSFDEAMEALRQNRP